MRAVVAHSMGGQGEGGPLPLPKARPRDLARTLPGDEAVVDALTDRRTGPRLGGGDLGLDVPDLVGPPCRSPSRSAASTIPSTPPPSV
ncbi:hypothetical protein AB0K00_18505 [Dactylosporangium sp. NPDC049525]|uniref:hypothetical protein n=1 Tax=Dactylosporangium sp. NPDC049525 TaxID=3154730 RepID=UPI0034326C27